MVCTVCEHCLLFPAEVAYHFSGVICLKKRRSILRRPLPQVQWPGETFTAPRATLVGSGRVLVENHLGITEFTQERVRLSARGGEIIVEGSGLSLAQARGRTLVVEGCISAVTMPEGGDGHG